MSTMRKHIVRQNAVNKFPDDVTLNEAERQPIDQASSVGYIDDSAQWSTKEKLTIETYIPESKDSHQITLGSDKMNHDLQCQKTQNKVQCLTAAPEESQNVELSPTKITSNDKEQLLNRCNKKLEHYGNHLLRRRNSKKIYLHLDTSLKKSASKQQDYKRVISKRDSSDGVPVSSGVLTDMSSLNNNKDNLTDEQKPTPKLNGHGFSDVSQELQKSPRNTGLESSCGDEGFVNGDARKSASLSPALNGIPEHGACAVPILKVNDENKSLSLTGQEKGEGFRNSKRSSGYGTGGSEEAPACPEDDSFYSSVFERSLSNNDTKPVSETDFRLSNEPLSNTGGQGTELPNKPEEIEEALGRMSSSTCTNAQRTVEMKNSSLPHEACIWKLPGINIKPQVRMKYKDGVNRYLARLEPGNDLLEIMRDNPQIPLPKMNETLKSGDSVDDKCGDPVVVSEEIGCLREDDEHPDPKTGIFREELQLLMSDASVATLACNGMHDRQVNGCLDAFDAVDGARCSTQGVHVKRIFQCLERAVFCKNLRGSCKDPMCVEGQMHIFHLKDLIQKGRLKECNPKLLEFLWSHSKKCTECQCVVPLCDSFHQRPKLSLEEHIKLMTMQSPNPYTNELAVSTQTVLQNGTFLMVNDEGSDQYALWKTAEVEYFNRMGDFCDSNIIRVCMHVSQQSGASDKVDEHFVIKKALQTGLNEKNVYLALKKPSPYLVKSYWCSDQLPGDTLLVCSAYHHTDWMELKSLLYHDVTPDLCRTILRQAAQAAQYLHSLNVVYLSWKCSSLLVDEENVSIKLCNFSHAVVLEQGVVTTSPDNVRKSIDPCFAAPEVLCGEALGFYSDVWGLGCLFYELLHRSKPYPDNCHRSPADIRQMVCQNKIQHTYPTEHLDIFFNCWEQVSAQRITVDGLLELLSEPTDVDR